MIIFIKSIFQRRLEYVKPPRLTRVTRSLKGTRFDRVVPDGTTSTLHAECQVVRALDEVVAAGRVCVDAIRQTLVCADRLDVCQGWGLEEITERESERERER